MAASGPRPVTVAVSKQERRELESMLSDKAVSARTRDRARIVLAADSGCTNTEIAELVGTHAATVRLWRRRWADGGMEGLKHKTPLAGPGRQMGRPLPPLVLDDEIRDVLERWTRRSTVSAGLALRARIVLGAAGAATNAEVAETLGCSVATVAKWRSRFIESGLVGLSDEYRPGRPRTISDAAVEDVILRTLKQAPPEEATHWSTRAMADVVGHSQSSISRIWRAFGLQPHRVDKFKLSTDPHFVDKVHDVVGLYLNPPERAVVICVDEKTGIQALDRTQLALPMLPGSPATATHDYVRHGTVDLYAALDVGTGQVITRTDKRHRSVEFRKFLDLVADQVPLDLDVHVVLDNASTHKTATIEKWLKRHPRWEFHFTPTSSSWLNLVERWFSELTTKKLQRSTHTSVRALTDDIIAWTETWNTKPRPFVWRKTADEILQSLRRYIERTLDS